MKHRLTTLLTPVLLGLLAPAAGAASIVTEDFESFAGSLLPFSSPGEGGGDGTDWTAALPAGWAMTFSGPVGDPIEFQGWRIMDVDSWIATEGDQSRSAWTRGGVGARGTVVVADPDAYDDGTNVDTGLFNTFLRTPSVDLSQLVLGSVVVEVDSFWRNEVTQMGAIEVTYDGGANFTTLHTYDSNVIADGALIDEHLVFNLNAPAAGTMWVRFSMTNGSNDWWWALDNIAITGTRVPEPGTAALGALAGAFFLRRRKRS